jgi:hypothetical protein
MGWRCANPRCGVKGQPLPVLCCSLAVWQPFSPNTFVNMACPRGAVEPTSACSSERRTGQLGGVVSRTLTRMSEGRARPAAHVILELAAEGGGLSAGLIGRWRNRRR